MEISYFHGFRGGMECSMMVSYDHFMSGDEPGLTIIFSLQRGWQKENSKMTVYGSSNCLNMKKVMIMFEREFMESIEQCA